MNDPTEASSSSYPPPPGTTTTQPDSAPAVNINSGTLEEPVYTTIWRDLRSIAGKIALVMVPRQEHASKLRDWDLWGPLFLCLSLAISLGISAKQGQSALVFAGVFVLMWVGAAVVTLNGQLLGGKLYFFQSICILGYCISPIVVASIAFIFLNMWAIRLPLILAVCGWSCFASTAFLSGTVPSDRKLLATYPIILFYMFMSYLVFVS